MKKSIIILAALCCQFSAFAKRTVVPVENPSTTVTATQNDNAKFIKRKVAIGRFTNETAYAKGAFYDKENDPMAKQALDMLYAKLGASGKFLLLERNDLDAILAEAKNGGIATNVLNADYMIVGSITQFGRKNTGKDAVFSDTKTQTVEAGVSIRLIEVSTGLVVYGEEAKGTAEVTTKQVMGVGATAGYDETLFDKALSAALNQLVENIINKCSDRAWKSYFMYAGDDAIIIGGGKSQNIAVGDKFNVYTKGKKVKNPQTGIEIELPGTKIGTATVANLGGDSPDTEYSIVTLDCKVDAANLSNYYISEK